MQKSTLIRTEVFTANTKTIVTNAYTIEAQNQQYYQNTPVPTTFIRIFLVGRPALEKSQSFQKKCF